MENENATMEKALKEIKSVIKSEKFIMGTEKTIKELRAGTLAKVFVSVNAPEEVMSEIDHFAGLSDDVEVVKLTIPNEELGVVCQKPFSISVVSLLK